MIDRSLMAALLDSIKDPVVLVDLDHVIRYMNKTAIAHYEEGPALLGRSVFDCHNADSRRQILEIVDAIQAGEEERLITDNEEHRIFMRAVRATDGRLLGYYERYEPPALPGRVGPGDSSSS
ncbi:MAG: PAS domain-containing protein [Phycisphaerae bacterium]